MRGIARLYLCLCEAEGCVANSRLVQHFASLDKHDVVAVNNSNNSSNNNNSNNSSKGNNTSSSSRSDKSNGHAAHTADVDVETMTATTAANAVDAVYKGNDNDGGSSSVDKACPAVLQLADNYVGDVGAAVCMRMLPLLRWLRVLDVRGVGAGARAVDALCAVLSASTREAAAAAATQSAAHCLSLCIVDLRDNADVYVTAVRPLLRVLHERLRLWRRVFADVATTSMTVSSAEAHALRARVTWWPVCVYCDDAHLPLSLARALAVYNADCAAVHAACGMQRATRTMAAAAAGEVSCCAATHTRAAYTDALVVHRLREPTRPRALVRVVREVNLHMDDYLATHAYLAALRSRQRQRRQQQQQHACVCCRSSNSGRTHCDGADATDASGTCNCRHHATSCVAAAQLCVDVGPAALSFLARSAAAVRLRRRRQQQQQQHDDEAHRCCAHDADSSGDNDRAHKQAVAHVRWSRRELLARVAALLHGLDALQTRAHSHDADDDDNNSNNSSNSRDDETRAAAATTMTAWLAHRDAQLPQRIARLRELHTTAAAAADAEACDSDATSTRTTALYATLRVLYQCVVAALVSTPLCDDTQDAAAAATTTATAATTTASSSPSSSSAAATATTTTTTTTLTAIFAAVESHIAALRASALGVMLDGGECSAVALQTRARALASAAYAYASSSMSPAAAAAATAAKQATATATASCAPRRVWPVWCTQLTYMHANHAEEVRAWRTAYTLGTTATHDTNEDGNTKDDEDDVAVCTCGDGANDDDGGGSNCVTASCVRPCAACCAAAMRALSHVLQPPQQQPHTLTRLAVMQPICDALPPELLLFFVDLYAREQSAQCGYRDSCDCVCASSVYIPAVLGKRSSVQATRHALCTRRNSSNNDECNDDDRDDDDHNKKDEDSTLVCIADYIAALRAERARVAALMSAFAEWYRLCTLEAVDVAAHAAQLRRWQSLAGTLSSATSDAGDDDE